VVDKGEVAKLIDHTLLKPTSTEEDVRQLCEDARKYGFASVVVNPCYVPLAKKLLRGSGVKVGTVVGFPLGASVSKVKLFEVKDAIKRGAQQVDFVINVGLLKSGRYEVVKQEMESIVRVARKRGVTTKAIIETCHLTDREKAKACKLAKEAGVDFVKTSTGFGPQGATVRDVKLMRTIVGKDLGVKASGGIRTLNQLLAMVKAGANRIGTSASVSIMRELEERE
jgi:deoxyribose-phosphate aldolase